MAMMSVPSDHVFTFVINGVGVRGFVTVRLMMDMIIPKVVMLVMIMA